MTPHELLPAALSFGGWLAGVLSKPVGVRIGHRIRARRIRALVRVPLRVRITADVADLLEKLRRASGAAS